MSGLRVENLHKAYRTATAVQDVSLSISPGEVVCLLGPSGCGKSTTLRIAAGVERQDRGTVQIDHRLVSDGRIHTPPEARGVGLMFQDFALFPHLTVGQNIAFGLDRVSKVQKEHAIQTGLQRVDLVGYADKFPHELSGGEQQRVALARALAPEPKIMLMDEPFSGLDNRLRDEVRSKTLALLKEDNAAVLMVTHDPDEALRMSDRIALMRHGRIVQQGTPYHVYNHPADRESAAFFSDVNIIQGVVYNRRTETPFGWFLTPSLSDGTAVEIVIRPQHLHIALGDRPMPAPSPQNGIPAAGYVVGSRFMGQVSLIETRMVHDDSLLISTFPGVFLPETGTALWLSLQRGNCFIFPTGKTGVVPSSQSVIYQAAAE